MNCSNCSNCRKPFNKKDAEEIFESEVAGFSYSKFRPAELCLDCAKERFREIKSSGSFICEECGGEFDFGTEYENFETECEGGGYDLKAYNIFAERVVCWECAKEFDD